MTKPKAQTIQQRFGFQDHDLKTPQHDEIMLWLTEHMPTILTMYCGSQWTEGEIQQGKEKAKEKLSWLVAQAEDALETYKCFSLRLDEYIQKYPDEKNQATDKYIWIDVLQHRIQDCLTAFHQWKDMPVPPQKSSPSFKIQWEWPIVDQKYASKYVIGFADLHVRFSKQELSIASYENKNPFLLGTPFGVRYSPSGLPYWSISKEDKEQLDTTGYWDYWKTQPRWKPFHMREDLLFEVKTAIPSLGELIRQIRLYQTYTDIPFIIVCPDTRFSKPILAQGIGFLHCKPTFDGQYEIGQLKL